MQYLTNILTSLVQSTNLVGSLAKYSEPLDHPCLATASHDFIDDLPLPAFAIGSDGSIKLITEE